MRRVRRACSTCGRTFEFDHGAGRARTRCDECRPVRAILNTAAWRSLRLRVLAEEPVCRICWEAPSTEVDHIVPLTDRLDLAMVRSNLQGACRRCNRRKGVQSTTRRLEPERPRPRALDIFD